MRYGILGDIHANLTALEAALDGFQREDVDQVVSVGDIVGYGAAPRECIELVRSAGAIVVKGNHDAACIGELDDRYFNNYAREAIRWTRTKVDRDEIEWLAALPLRVDLEHCHVAHGSLFRPELFDYIQSPTDGEPSLDIMEKRLCFVGHTHVPIALLRLADDPERTAECPEDEIDAGDASRCLVNVGSVGQPRDEDSRTAFAIYDSDRHVVWIRRSEYDIDREAARIREAGLPSVLADRLYLGV